MTVWPLGNITIRCSHYLWPLWGTPPQYVLALVSILSV